MRERERGREREQSEASGRVQSRERGRLNMARLSVKEKGSKASRLENTSRSRSGKSAQLNSRL